jgi:NAD(P)H-nitrite reductase large subunit
MRTVIIGNHAAGLSAAETLRLGDDAMEIVVISKEDVPPYSRSLISYLLSNDRDLDGILWKEADFYDRHKITPMLGRTVIALEPEKNSVVLENDEKVGYDSLVIASGGHPAMPDIPGIDNEGVFTFQSLEDAMIVKERAEDVQSVVILGGGLIGLKAAEAFAKLGKKVSVMVRSPNVLSQIVSAREAEIFEEYLSGVGVEIGTGVSVTGIAGDGKVQGVETKERGTAECDMVIVAKGVRPNMQFVTDGPVATDYGVVTDAHLRTNIENIYAAGDVAQNYDSVRDEDYLNTLWPLAVGDGRIAAENILGRDSALNYRTSMNSIRIGDAFLISCGLVGSREDLSDAENVYIDGDCGLKRLVFRGDTLVGFSLVGDVANAGILTSLVSRGVDTSMIRDDLLAGRHDFAAIAPLIKAFEDKFPEPEFRQALG